MSSVAISRLLGNYEFNYDETYGVIYMIIQGLDGALLGLEIQ